MSTGNNFTSYLYFDLLLFLALLKDNSRCGIFKSKCRTRKEYRDMTFSSSAQRIRDSRNAGGNSMRSEVLSCEFLSQFDQFQLSKTEREAEYFPYGGSITDYVCTIAKQKVGVSVTRAMTYKGQFTRKDACRLLIKKLKGVKESNRNSLENWNKQILHIWTPNMHTADIIVEVYNQLSEEMRSNTVVIVTTAK